MYISELIECDYCGQTVAGGALIAQMHGWDWLTTLGVTKHACDSFVKKDEWLADKEKAHVQPLQLGREKGDSANKTLRMG